MLKDEQQALQLEFVCLQDKFKIADQNYNELVERYVVMKHLQQISNLGLCQKSITVWAVKVSW